MLAAHLPGNGMGGSTNPASVIATPATNPTTGSYSTTSFPATGANGVQPTACGGASYIPAFRQTQATVASAATVNNGMIGTTAACAGGVCGSMATAATGTCANGGTVIGGSCTNGQTTGKNACSAGSPGGSGVPTSGSVDSNTVTFGPIMPAVTQVARASEVAPFAVSETGGLAGVANAMAAAAAGIGKLCGGLTNSQIQRATRGIASVSGTGTGPTVAANSPPIACISSSVCFNDILVPATNAAPAAIAGGAILLAGNSRCVRLCDPKGAPALAGTNDQTYAQRKTAYLTNRMQSPAGGATNAA